MTVKGDSSYYTLSKIFLRITTVYVELQRFDFCSTNEQVQAPTITP